MRLQPSLSVKEQFLDFILADPVMFGAVEYRDQDIEMGQQFTEARLCLQADGMAAARAPFGKFRVQRIAVNPHGIAERFKEFAYCLFAAAAGQHADCRRQGEFRGGAFGTHGATSAQGGAVDLGNGRAEKGRGHIGAVVDIVKKPAVSLLADTAARQIKRIEIQQQGRGADLVIRLGIKYVGFAVVQLHRLRTRGVFVQQIAKIRGFRTFAGDGQKHARVLPVFLPGYSEIILLSASPVTFFLFVSSKYFIASSDNLILLVCTGVSFISSAN
jgi:hypothetical protein